jgi:large subunit ribosomal protein L22
VADARAVQRGTRQSPYKMRLVIDQIRGKSVNEALATLKFSKKHAARQIEKVLTSAVANAEFRGRSASEPVDVDELFVKHAVINEGPKLKRFMPAAMGRANPIQKRTSHVEIVIAERTRTVGRDQGLAGGGARPAAKGQRGTTRRTSASPTPRTSKKKGR